MPVKDALKLIEKISRDSDLQKEVEHAGVGSDLADLVRIGSICGLDFTEKELETAFRIDWGMRKVFYCGERPL
jgi:hypothetical protein